MRAGQGAGPPPAVATSWTLPRGPSPARTKAPKGRQEAIDMMGLELTSSAEYRNVTSAMTGYARDQRCSKRQDESVCSQETEKKVEGKRDWPKSQRNTGDLLTQNKGKRAGADNMSPEATYCSSLRGTTWS